MADKRQPALYRNLVSEAGLFIAVIALINIIFLVIADASGEHASPYLGIFAYMVVPGIMGFGIVLTLLGMWRERRRRARANPDEIPIYPKVDLNDPRTRAIIMFSVVGLIVFVMISLFGSYKAYEFTESDRFCGTLCHKVMHPEYTAYKASPHARVGCVNCHVGSGANWYVKSKLSGSYQLYSVVAHKYPSPIPSPVENLRPAQETCEQCHWPQKFWGAQLKVFNHFGYDEANTPREVRMLIKTGGGNPQSGLTAGIHWHMNIANKVTYVASDRQRQKIEWVRIEDKQGHVTEYKLKDSKLTDAQIAASEKRRMDCVDCHNRPTHIYVPPDRAVDRALLANDIDRTLPFIKQKAVEAIVADYKTTPEAVAGIQKTLETYYKTQYPQVYQQKHGDIERAIAHTQEIFQRIRFPEMKVDWRVHPDNIGHFYYQGCFRCHDNNHVSKDGKVITKDCNVCHTVLGQEESGKPMTEMPQVAFQHPIDMGDMTEFVCADCHTGAPMQ